jgi:hypothetical protein
MDCKKCEFTKCLMRTNDEFDICPVEEAKRKFESEKEKQQQK